MARHALSLLGSGCCCVSVRATRIDDTLEMSEPSSPHTHKSAPGCRRVSLLHHKNFEVGDDGAYFVAIVGTLLNEQPNAGDPTFHNEYVPTARSAREASIKEWLRTFEREDEFFHRKAALTTHSAP